MSALKWNRRIVLFSFLLAGLNSYALVVQNDSAKIDYEKIYAYCLDGNITPALRIMELYDSKKLSAKDLKFKTAFENRFKYDTDKSGFPEGLNSSVIDLLTIYRDYWRSSLLTNSNKYDTLLKKDLCTYFTAIFHLTPLGSGMWPEDTIDVYLKRYISSFGYHTTGFGQTGKYLDLLVWKNQKDTTYSFSIYDEKISTSVVFMDDFVTLGWEEYATMGRAYPGGLGRKKINKAAYEALTRNTIALTNEGPGIEKFIKK